MWKHKDRDTELIISENPLQGIDLNNVLNPYMVNNMGMDKRKVWLKWGLTGRQDKWKAGYFSHQEHREP